MSNDPVCDFCSDPVVKWRYKADDFVMGEFAGVRHSSIGDWAACQACHDLIEAGDLHNLTERSLTQYGPLSDTVRDSLRPVLQEAHRRFARVQRGEATPI